MKTTCDTISNIAHFHKGITTKLLKIETFNINALGLITLKLLYSCTQSQHFKIMYVSFTLACKYNNAHNKQLYIKSIFYTVL